MSDHCKSCAYDVKAKTGPSACPFNYLYWDFVARHRARLSGNPRMAQMVRTWDRFDAAKQAEIASDSAQFLSRLG